MTIGTAEMWSEAWRNSRKFRFLTIGAWNTLFAYSAFSALYLLLHGRLHYMLISVLTHVLAVSNAFICQRWLVFRSRTRWLKAFLRFNLVQIVVLFWGLGGLAVMVEVLHLSPLLGQSLVIAVAIAGSYVMNSRYSFRA